MFEYFFEETVCEAVRKNTTVSVCVDATQVNFLSVFTVPSMMSRFLALVNKLHDYPETVGHMVKGDAPNDLVSRHLGSTAIIIASPLAKTIINGIVSVMPTKRPVEFFNEAPEAIEFGHEKALELLRKEHQ